MALNMKTITQALAKTAAVIEKTVQTTVQEVTGPKPLQDYELIDQIGSAGPGLVWKLYSAKSARESTRPQQYPIVCVWILDKKALSESRARAGLSKAAEDSFLDLIRSDAGRLVRLRHPGVVHVVQALDENKNAMAMVTEPLFASVANALGNLDNVGKVPKDLKGMVIGLLEVKHGLLQIAESLNFLHNNAHLCHQSISPEMEVLFESLLDAYGILTPRSRTLGVNPHQLCLMNDEAFVLQNVLITSSGAWKLGGFCFAISVNQPSGDMANVQAFHYAEYDVEDSVLPLYPSLNYTAPELVQSKASSVGCASDIFSFGCLAYHLITRKPLFDCHNNVKMYMNTLNYLSNETFSSIPRELVPDLQRMLSANESFRPTALDFTGSPFFRDDTRLRALRFLDHMLERDNMQKSEFLKALSDMWKDFDSRVLRYKVLPPLCAELRNLVMQPMILPMVLTIADSQEENDFEMSTLPALVPVLSTAAGETLLLLVKHAELIINKTSHELLVSNILPFLVRAYDENDARIQEEVLKKSAFLAKQLDSELVKQTILPHVHGLALKTTVAAVRVNALLCLSELVQTLDKHAVLEILQTIQRCTAVDRSAPTLMCTLGIANSILKQYGVDFVAEHVLPLLTPLLTAPQLNVQQFAKYMLFVKDILRKIEERRGVTLTGCGVPDGNLYPSANGLHSHALNKTSGTATSATKSSAAWDEDWVTVTKGSASSKTNISVQVTHSIQPTQMTSLSLLSGVSSQQMGPSCPPVEIEWPPQSSLGPTPLTGDDDKANTGVGASPKSNFDDIDPFVDWPPWPSGSLGSSVISKNGGGGVPNNRGSNLSTNMPTSINSDNSWGFNIATSLDTLVQTHGGSTLKTNSMNSASLNTRSSIGFLKQSEPISGLGNADRKTTDIGSIFVSSKNDQTAPKLAPPPLTAVGRGRGRGRAAASTSRSSHIKSSSEQPHLLDFL